jgi:putative membrane protein
VTGRGWLNLFVISLCLGFSALYQLFEWAVGVITGDSAENFLGTQGYIWDTQSDMAMALAGAILALLVLSRIHERQLKLLIDRSRRARGFAILLREPIVQGRHG